jgi:uncharacterized protein (DUF362 family)
MSYAQPSLMPSFLRPPSRVAIVRSPGYDRDLGTLMFEVLREFDLPVSGKKVVLKPNFVEPDPEGIINTHPAVVAAAREAFLRMGAQSVLVAEGAGHERDSEAIVETNHLRDFLGPLHDLFVDLNLDEVHQVKLRTQASRLKQLYLPRTILEADYFVSMPKLKTHHWVGVTLSLKNLFGIVPGCCYGWPKNILHWAGIVPSILDLNSTVRPDFAIVDGIIGMEGNGPIQGTAKPTGVLILGDDPVAVDSTCARVMGLEPRHIEYLSKAAMLLGHLQADKIQQLGESVASVMTPYAVLPAFQALVATSSQ